VYIAIVQSNPTVGDIRGNCERALAVIDDLSARAYPPDLVVFPAYALTGSPIRGMQTSDAFAGECLAVAHEFIAKASLPTLIGTMIPQPITDDMGFTNEPEVLYCKDGTGGALGFVDINNDWPYDQYASSITVLIDGHTVSILLDEYPESNDDFSSSDMILLLLSKEYRGTNTMFTASTQISYLRGLALKNKAWVAVANLVGAQDASVFDGASLLINSSGDVVAAAGPFVEDALICNINFDETATEDSSAKGLGAQPESGPTASLGASGLIKPLLPYEADWKALSLFVADYVRKNGFSDVVVGLSGGIDSAVTAALACDALGSDHVHGVLMPGQFSSENSLTDAREQAALLGMSILEIPIEDAVRAFDTLSVAAIGNSGSALAQQNIQARIRTLILMHLSNTFGWLMLNTGNKSERAMGYSTLYGDTAGAFSPLGNIYKTDVYGLAHWRNCRSLAIPQNVIDKEPSAELCEGQKDSDSLPPYEVLDHILRMHIEEGLGVDQILQFTARDAFAEPLTSDLVKSVLNSVRSAEYKRRQEPLAPTLGYMDMNEDRDWPVTNGFKDHEDLVISDIDIDDYLSMIQSWKMPKGWGFLAN
jgi:NAD+ synthase (glutamine-hydrolysing)